VTGRQRAILRAVIAEFMKKAEPVGSVSIVSGYNVGVSPATVRHEMVELSDMGYLNKTHSSAGRFPTNLGLRFFVHELMEEEELSNEDKVALRMSFFPKRFDEEKLMKDVLDYLSSETGYASVSLMDGVLRYYGVSTLTDFEELRNIEIIEAVLNILENQNVLSKIFDRGVSRDVCTIIGDECDVEGMRPCAIVFSPIKYLNKKDGFIGILGPRRMRYSRVIPVVRFVRDIIEHSVRGW